ncbi:DUF6728 family protein [Fulvivirga ligni]|uniref:DUF6728 family protein n=1 Tax=Fulvivirga ligni TaxID=2904246 RepID=UPI001F2B8CE1|nr:hypothetical protein LVD16_13145 [Fulvivirga ligni]
MTTESNDKRSRNTFKEYFQLGEVFGYFFRGKDPNRPRSFSLRMMHGINKISLLIFLIALIILISRHIF